MRCVEKICVAPTVSWHTKMKKYLYYLAFVTPLLVLETANAAELSSWLENLKREVTKLGVNEKGYLHSIGHMRNAVMKNESLLLVSEIRLEDLDINLLPNGAVEVFSSRREKGDIPGLGVEAEGTRRSKCENEPSFSPRLSFIKRTSDPSISDNNRTAIQQNLLAYVENFVERLVLNNLNIGLSPYFDKGSRYGNLMKGGQFEESRHKLVVQASYNDPQKRSFWNPNNTKRQAWGGRKGRVIFREKTEENSGWRKKEGNHISIKLIFIDGNSELSEWSADVVVGDTFWNGRNSGKGSIELSPRLEELTNEINYFLAGLYCSINYSNLVSTSGGKLILASGSDSGLTEGDQCLLMPKSGYLKKRGLLSGVDQIAIARIKTLSPLTSELEVEEGKISIEEGVEFFVRPLLELI